MLGNEQAALLRMSKLSDANVENIAEEIATLGRHEKRELVSETGLPESALPDERPWTFDQAMQDQPM